MTRRSFHVPSSILASCLVLLSLLASTYIYFHRQHTSTESRAEKRGIETNKKLLLLPTQNDVVINPGKKVTVVVYEDTDCRFCKEYGPILRSLAEKNPDTVSIYFRYKLLPIYQHSRKEAELLECVKNINRPAYFDFKEDLFSIVSSENLDYKKLVSMARKYTDQEVLDTCLADKKTDETIRDIEAVAFLLGVTKVPYTFIFSDASPIISLIGLQSEATLERIIQNIDSYE